MVRDVLAGRMGVDAIAFISMTAALVLGQPLAGIVVAVMYAGGNVLEDFAVGRAERDLKSLVDRAPRRAHRRRGEIIDEIAVEDVAIDDLLLVRGGEIVPVDGIIISQQTLLDELALTGEPIPVEHKVARMSRVDLNAGQTFELRATATAGRAHTPVS